LRRTRIRDTLATQRHHGATAAMNNSISGPASRIYFSQRLRLHYVDWGNAGAPPLILLHGGRDHCRNWDWVAERLRRDWHIIAPDLRGHGDSQWSSDGNYSTVGYTYDLAQLIHQQKLAPVTIIAHSLGGVISLRSAGIYPANVKALVAIEGLLRGPRTSARAKLAIGDRMRRWIEEQRALAGRLPRRYPSIEEALKRMQEANRHLSPDQPERGRNL
jgi:pimeloyl-ACP methyl ester carboxylesterase